MSKGRDTKAREKKKKPEKTLKEKRADKAARKDGTFTAASGVGKAMEH
ncbi:MAG: hypothetical protein R6V61_06145 [Wenzhouxiangellaceae bacterium]